jgi:OHCU decarboxylase
MRADPVDFELVSPGTLQDVLSLLSNQPSQWMPIAGGTDVMVLYAAGKLPSRKLVNLWNLPELRRIEVSPEKIRIGSACTYTDLRRHPVISQEFPLLAIAASWTGGIANQNRGTLGGNIANASPAADSLPALLVYDAVLTLVSVRGAREIPYRNFHTGYKQTALACDELIRDIVLPRRFSGYVSYVRKVGTRNAQAISKVCLAALGRMENGLIADVRLAAGSVAPVPLRLMQTERLLTSKQLEPALIAAARKIAIQEIRPINDIRSTARYRAAVASNLVVEFLEKLALEGSRISAALVRWNGLPAPEAVSGILPCCGSKTWAAAMVSRRPVQSEAILLGAADEIWRSLSPSDWLQTFRSHPRIGQSSGETPGSAQSSAWSAQEQQKVSSAGDPLKLALAQGNREYEKKFGRIFIVCATGKSAAEILEILRRRLQNDDATELQEAAEEQRQIMHLRLEKWLAQ